MPMPMLPLDFRDRRVAERAAVIHLVKRPVVPVPQQTRSEYAPPVAT